jgi:hypothetical protein
MILFNLDMKVLRYPEVVLARAEASGLTCII